MNKENPFYNKVKKKDCLYTAWRKVYENGINSKSPETREEIKQFSAIALKEIGSLAYRLSTNKFHFSPSKGILKKREGKSPRPIVSSLVQDKIVRRAILDVLQEDPSLRQYVTVSTSFGGIEKRGVPSAIEAAYKAMQDGASWYIRSDIEGFFTKIPREEVLRIITGIISDAKFIELLKNAIATELENLHQLGEHSILFPLHEIGVAQGCCLSPLVGNILLHDFDIIMNEGNIVCLRYIDDFIILGATHKEVVQAFKKALRSLDEHKLHAYDPIKNKDKAEIGETKKGFEFLGCDVHPGLIRPDKKSRKRLLTRIEHLFKESAQLMSSPVNLSRKRKTLIDTLEDASNIIRGWGNQYSFCNDHDVMNHLDSKIDEEIRKYMGHYKRAKEKISPEHFKHHRRLLGVHLLCDSKADPIIKKPS